MNVETQVNKFKDFLDKEYAKDLAEAVRKGERSFVIDFKKLVRYNEKLADLLLDDSENLLKALELAVEQFDFEKAKNPRVMIKNLPESQKIGISEIRCEHINKLLSVEGVIRQKSDVRPQALSAKFECPNCSHIMNILQLDTIFKEPSHCGCGRKGKFRLISKEQADSQGIVLEESTENLKSNQQPRRLNVFLKDDLVSPFSERKTAPGSKIVVNGIIKDIPIPSKTGGKLTKSDLMIEANYIESSSYSFYDLKITPEEKEKIIELSKDPKVYEKITQSLVPSIYGYDEIKEAIILQLFGGVRKVRADSVVSRGDFHILLIGDPGAGKSAIITRVSKIAPKGRYVSGTGVSGVGLTASVVKDEFLRGYAVEAGAMVLCSEGVCCIDEMDKISDEDRGKMHEAMENQTVSISKANVHATLIARTTVLASANPKYGRFETFGDSYLKQIAMPSTLVNRFDLIFVILDTPDKERDTNLSRHMLKLHQNPKLIEAELQPDFLKKYISYARQNCSPTLTDEALEEIERYYLKMRSMGGEGEIKTIPISPRQLEALTRMSEASAKVRLSDKVNVDDVFRAIRLLEYCLMQVGFDKELNKFDIDKFAVGTSASQRNLILSIRETIDDMSVNTKNIPEEEFVQAMMLKGFSKVNIEECLSKLKRMGDILEPRRGFLMRV